MSKFKLRKKLEIGLSVDDYREEEYKNWRETKKDSGDTYFMLATDFEKHLKDISTGALKLYIYYGFKSGNYTGKSWYSIDTISEFFKVTPRAINKWNAELIKKGLISRTSGVTPSKNTFLLPLSFTLMETGESSIEEYTRKYFNNDAFKEVFGEANKAFHLFQWRKNKENNKYEIPLHMIVVNFRKVFEDEKYYKDTSFAFNISKSYTKKIDKMSLKEDIYIFQSDYVIEGLNVPIQGIAVKGEYNLTERKTLISVIKELIDPRTQITIYNSVNLISE